MLHGLGDVLGLLAALALLSLGLFALPGPGMDTVKGLFTLLWLLITFTAAVAFGREVWRRERLKRVRLKWRSSFRRNAALRERGSNSGSGIKENSDRLSQRERRLD